MPLSSLIFVPLGHSRSLHLLRLIAEMRGEGSFSFFFSCRGGESGQSDPWLLTSKKSLSVQPTLHSTRPGKSTLGTSYSIPVAHRTLKKRFARATRARDSRALRYYVLSSNPGLRTKLSGSRICGWIENPSKLENKI